MDYPELASTSIAAFTLDESGYERLTEDENITILGSGDVFLKTPVGRAKININFNKARHCKVFIGQGFVGVLKINITGDDTVVYIGDNCVLRGVNISVGQTNGFVAVGNGVTTTARNTWISGEGVGAANPALLIGDDCLFSRDIVIRNSDGHPVFSAATDLQINEPTGMVHIEPHVWIGERAAILKSTIVGACSIIGFGSTVTRDVPRFSLVKGVPAVSTKRADTYWARDTSEQAMNKAKHFYTKYSAPHAP